MINQDAPTLTEKQAKVLHFLAAIRACTGFMPTYQELGDYLGVSRVSIFDLISMLETKGYITKQRDKARAVALTKLGKQWHSDRPFNPNITLICNEIITNHCATGV